MTTDQQAQIAIVFAGGPHTASRFALLKRLTAREPFGAIYLTGKEFADDPSFETDIRRLLPSALVQTDPSTNTWQSCRFVASNIRHHQRRPVSATAITSNYHAPRLTWLLRSILPNDVKLQMETCADISPSRILHCATARRLVVGEFVSWLYCLPLGLLCRLFIHPRRSPIRCACPA